MARKKERSVIVGQAYGDAAPSNWTVWDQPLEDVIEKLETRSTGYPPNGSKFLVYEITVKRAYRIGTHVQVEELDP